jgi:hypothetical protein
MDPNGLQKRKLSARKWLLQKHNISLSGKLQISVLQKVLGSKMQGWNHWNSGMYRWSM